MDRVINETVYESRNLSIIFDRKSNERLWFTFGSLEPGPFGREYVAGRGDSAICFVPKSGDWYQYDDIWAALNFAAALAKPFRHKIAYGSSMGAFAALAFARELEPDLIIAAAPQCSIHPLVVGHFDQRWADVASRLRFRRADCRAGLESSDKVVLIYDPLHREDRRNAQLIEKAVDAVTLTFPMAGHGVLHTLAAQKLVRRLIDAIAVRRFDEVKGLRGEYKVRARTVWNYWYALGERFKSMGRPKRALDFYAWGMLLGPNEHDLHAACSDCLWSLGHKVEAVRRAKQSVILAPWAGGHRVRLALQQLDLGDLEAAESTLTQADQDIPDCAPILNGLSIIRGLQGDLATAVILLTRATVLDPGNEIWRDQLDQLKAALSSRT